MHAAPVGYGTERRLCRCGGQPARARDEAHHLGRPDAASQIGHHKRTLAAHPAGIGFHDGKVGADLRGEVGLVNHQ